MNEADFQADLSQFAHHLNPVNAGANGSTAQTPHQIAAEARVRQEKLRETVRTLQDSLDHLRLSVKYLVFDLEATRRENEYLRKLLDTTRGG